MRNTLRTATAALTVAAILGFGGATHIAPAISTTAASATSPMTGLTADESAAPDRVGSLVSAGQSAFALAQDGSAVYETVYEADKLRDTWKKIGGPATALYAGGAGLFATDPDSGELYRYDGEPDKWTRAGGPAAEFAVGDDTVYALSADRSTVSERTGTGADDWQTIGGPAGHLYAGPAGLFATNPDTGDLYRYDGEPGRWTQVGGPGATFAVSGNHLYGLAPDRSSVSEWTGAGTDWTRIGGPVAELYGGGAGLYATAPETGDLKRYEGQPDSWTQAGGPGATFTVGVDQVYGASPDRSTVSRYVAPGQWQQLAGMVEATSITPEQRLQRMQELMTEGWTGFNAWQWARTDHVANKRPDPYGFDWSANGCNVIKDKLKSGAGFDLRPACMRHDFGYRNFRDLLGEDGFRNGVIGLTGTGIGGPKAQTDEVFLKDMSNECRRPLGEGSNIVERPALMVAACDAAAQEVRATVVLFG
ncbi:phospholipase A2 [Streptomyces sp. NPDC021012]|uniref:phospholipase A2 n=1 Tax=Streptomyces sp. NPDC021012 TaxID=3365107 RepID=UPI00379B19DF